MYKIIYKNKSYKNHKVKDELVAETEELDRYLKLMKWYFCLFPLDDVNTKDRSIMNFQVKDTDKQTVVDVIDLISLKEIVIMQNNINVRYYDHLNTGICKLLKNAKKEPWYYNEENISKLKRYITYYKDEIVGYSDYPYDCLLQYVSSNIGSSEKLKLRGLCKEEFDWLNGKDDKNNKKINDFYIKDLIGGEVITDFRHLVKDEKGESAFADGVGIGKEYDWVNKSR